MNLKKYGRIRRKKSLFNNKLKRNILNNDYKY